MRLKVNILKKITSNDDVPCDDMEPETYKELVSLKYVILKNLASINSSNCKNYSLALDYLIQVSNFFN